MRCFSQNGLAFLTMWISLVLEGCAQPAAPSSQSIQKSEKVSHPSDSEGGDPKETLTPKKHREKKSSVSKHPIPRKEQSDQQTAAIEASPKPGVVDLKVAPEVGLKANPRERPESKNELSLVVKLPSKADAGEGRTPTFSENQDQSLEGKTQALSKDLSGLSSVALYLMGEGIRNLTEEQIHSLTSKQIEDLNVWQFKVLANHLSRAQIQSLTEGGVNHLFELGVQEGVSRIEDLTAEQVQMIPGFYVARYPTYLASRINDLSIEQINSADLIDIFRNLSSIKLRQVADFLKGYEVSSLGKEQVAVLLENGFSRIDNLSHRQIRDLTVDQVKGLSPESLCRLSSDKLLAFEGLLILGAGIHPGS